MKYIFKKKETIQFGFNDIKTFDIGDEVEEERIHSVSKTLLKYYLDKGILQENIQKKSISTYENKMLNTKIENKKISLDVKRKKRVTKK